MCAPDMPTPPDPRQTSAASTSTNVGTAVANAWLGNISEKGPNGSTSVDQTGSKSWYDPYTDKTYDVPTFTRTTTLSPEQQAIADQNSRAGLNLSTLGANLSGTLGNQLTGNFKLGNDATESRLMDLGRKRLDPMLDRRAESERTRLANAGVAEGSTGWNRAMERVSQSENDAFNQLLLNGRAQSNQELVTEDNQRINQISALMNGGQVSQPNFMGANMPTIPTTDVGGLINANYNQQVQQAQMQNQNSQNIMGGLFGLGGRALMLSDERTKTDVEPVGELKGHPLYEYRYKGKFDDGKRHIGVMAQDAEKKRPDAVIKGRDGLRRVDYGALFGAEA